MDTSNNLKRIVADHDFMLRYKDFSRHAITFKLVKIIKMPNCVKNHRDTDNNSSASPDYFSHNH